jgi:hypothetical protein
VAVVVVEETERVVLRVGLAAVHRLVGLVALAQVVREMMVGALAEQWATVAVVEVALERWVAEPLVQPLGAQEAGERLHQLLVHLLPTQAVAVVALGMLQEVLVLVVLVAVALGEAEPKPAGMV